MHLSCQRFVRMVGVLIAILGFVFAGGMAARAQEPDTDNTSPTSPPFGTRNDVLERQIVGAINRYRREQNLPPIAIDSRLKELALKHSQILSTESLVDTGDFGVRMQEAIAANGTIIHYAENTAHVWPQKDIAGVIIQKWTQSQRFNRNLISHWRSIGVGITMTRDGDVYICANFADGAPEAKSRGGGS